MFRLFLLLTGKITNCISNITKSCTHISCIVHPISYIKLQYSASNITYIVHLISRTVHYLMSLYSGQTISCLTACPCAEETLTPCPRIMNKVCAADGQTYNNDCLARQAKVYMGAILCIKLRHSSFIFPILSLDGKIRKFENFAFQ